MTAYQVADGHDNEAGFSDIAPQPRSEGIKVTRRSFSASGTVTDQGEYVDLVWSVVEDVTTYQSILTQFGINNALSNNVTVKVRDQTFAFVNKNGTAIQPEAGRDVRWRRYFPRDVVILIKNLSDT